MKEVLKKIEEIPEELWQEKESALEIFRTLVEDEELYEISLEKSMIYAEFVCSLLPESFWKCKENIIGAAEIIADFMLEYCEYVSVYDVKAVFDSMPQTMWKNEGFVTDAINLVIDRAYMMDDLNCISEIIPESVWKNDEELQWCIFRIFNADERNMGHLSLFPQKVWGSARLITQVLSCLADALENDRAWGTVYSNFRGNNEEYMEDFLSYVPEQFKLDKEFVLDCLEYEYFCDAFYVIYDWIDSQLWSDKEFVMEVLEKDCSAVARVSDALTKDEDIQDFIEENGDD